MVNQQSVLEHIANKTGRSVKELTELIKFENIMIENDNITFAGIKGCRLYGEYLRAIRITKIASSGGDFVVEVPKWRYELQSSPQQTVKACLSGMYRGYFKKLFGADFDF